MAHHHHDNLAHHNRGLKLDITHAEEPPQAQDYTDYLQRRSQRPDLHASTESEDTIRRITSTPPIEIPGQHDGVVDVERPGSPKSTDALIEQYLKDRETSISFDNVVRTSSGNRQDILEPARKPAQHGPRGRSLAKAMSEQHTARPHSESDRSHYDPHTGRHLPQYSDSPPTEEPRYGEARFPLLQQTIDALARQQTREILQPMSMTSESTMSPIEEVLVTPKDQTGSPTGLGSSMFRKFSTSYESPRPRSQRKASERWRDGEAAPDFFSRAGSLRKGDRDPARRASRRDTLSSTKSPRSAASSFLRGFSMSSGGDDSAPPPVDAEGSTVGEDYVLGKMIGYGGFSIIREVKQISSQTGTQRTLAVKIVKKQIDGKSKAENDSAQSEFEHEVDLWRLLNHKHILALEAVYELKEATFCFIPLNTGGTLFDVYNNNRQGLRPDLAASYSYQLASALRYLHLDARVVHRDVKLENCLIDMTRVTSEAQPGFLRLCDFGLAEWISNDGDSASSSDGADRDRPLSRYFGPSDSSSSAFAGGSLEYAAPEILRIATSSSGNVQPYDLPPQKSIISPAVDIWAMGVCLYTLISGRRPFQDGFQPRVVMAILAGDYDKQLLKDKAPNEDAYRLVKRCLSMVAAKRPGISEVFENAWFDEVRSESCGSDNESESAKAGGWRL